MRQPPSISGLRAWRMEIKRQLLAQRGWMCERCGKERVTDLDESILPRVDMVGLSDEQKLKAYSEINLTLSCARCNREEAHDREAAWERACGRYGGDAVRTWYSSLRLKVPRAEWLEHSTDSI